MSDKSTACSVGWHKNCSGRELTKEAIYAPCSCCSGLELKQPKTYVTCQCPCHKEKK